ncbi:hypothetical protein Q5752_003085 [Cryptotrichosporon argae]
MPTIAYLPPVSLPPLPLPDDVAADRLRFIRAQPDFGDTQSQSYASQSLSTRQRLSQHVALPRGPPHHTDANASVTELLTPTSLRFDVQQAVQGEHTTGTPSASAAAPTGDKRKRDDADRRRSRRIAGSLSHDDTAGPDSLLSSLASSFSPTAAPTSSISLLPTWSVPLDRLAPLHSLFEAPRAKGWGYSFTVLACVLEAGGVLDVARKTALMHAAAHGQGDTVAVASWKVTAPPDKGGDPVALEVKMWDRVARECAGVRKGDVVLIENAELKHATARNPAHLSLTASARPRVTILYRTLPRRLANPYVAAAAADARAAIVDEDRRLRPDLRVTGDAGVRRVAESARWLADWLGEAYLAQARFSRKLVCPRTGLPVSFADCGHADGTPMLYVPPSAASRWLAAPQDPILRRRGIRMICVDRPGLGATPPVPLADRLRVSCAHIVSVLEHLGVAVAHVLATSAGIYYALHLLLAHSDIFPSPPRLYLLGPWSPPLPSTDPLAYRQPLEWIPERVLTTQHLMLPYLIPTAKAAEAAYNGASAWLARSLVGAKRWLKADTSEIDIPVPEQRRVWPPSAKYLTMDYMHAEEFSGIGEEHMICLNRAGLDTGAAWFEATASALGGAMRARRAILRIGIWWGTEDGMVPRNGQKWLNETLAVPGAVEVDVHIIPDGDHSNLMQMAEAIGAVYDEVMADAYAAQS